VLNWEGNCAHSTIHDGTFVLSLSGCHRLGGCGGERYHDESLSKLLTPEIKANKKSLDEDE
jgi:hypothetical protein